MVVANNVFDRNPRYRLSDNANLNLGLVFTDSSDCTITGNHIQGSGDIEAAVILRRCRRMNLTGCTILDYTRCGLLLEDLSESRVSACLIHTDQPDQAAISLKATGGRNNMIVNNLLGSPTKIDAGVGVIRDNMQP